MKLNNSQLNIILKNEINEKLNLITNKNQTDNKNFTLNEIRLKNQLFKTKQIKKSKKEEMVKLSNITSHNIQTIAQSNKENDKIISVKSQYINKNMEIGNDHYTNNQGINHSKDRNTTAKNTTAIRQMEKMNASHQRSVEHKFHNSLIFTGIFYNILYEL